MTTTIEKLLINLRVISQLQPYQKVNAKSEFLSVEYYTWFVSLSRWIRTDDRHTCLKRLNEIITDSKDIINNKDNNYYEKRIKKSLKQCINGLENLKKTYENDITTISYLELIIENIIECVGKDEDEDENKNKNTTKNITIIKNKNKDKDKDVDPFI